MKKLFKQYNQVNADINVSKTIIENMQQWNLKTPEDMRDLRSEMEKLRKLRLQKFHLLNDIEDAAGVEILKMRKNATAA